jgi:hypothetical protein
VKPDKRLLRLVDELRALVAEGEVQGVFVVMAYATERKNPFPEYDVMYRANNIDDMLLEVRQQVTRIRSREAAAQRENRN